MFKPYLKNLCTSVSIAFLLSAAAYPNDRCADQNARTLTGSNFAKYQRDTQAGLELMRNVETGLLRDKIQILQKPDGKFETKILNNNTSPTNIALDLINQMANPKTLIQVLATLTKVAFHEDTGLFYSWYSTGKDLQVINNDVSSVDNIHLALALWTIKETYPDTRQGRQAATLFNRMNFSAFYDASTGLIGGNLRHANGSWTLDAYRFSNLGSEARSIYSLAWALDLLKTPSDLKFPQKAVNALTAEFLPWNNGGTIKNILRTWNGGAFQLLLPKLLLNEELYSSILADSFKNYAQYILKEGQRLNYPVPAAHSASNFGVEGEATFNEVPSYEGNSGSPELVSTTNVDINAPVSRDLWAAVFTPHAAMMAATADPTAYGPVFLKMEKLGLDSNVLYQKGAGFLDGYHVKGTYNGKVVPVQLSLDQGMIALALDQMTSRDGMSASGRALLANKQVRARLTGFYQLLDQKLRSQDIPPQAH